MASLPVERHLLRAKDLADARYADPLTVDDLAGAANLSRAHFSREFRTAFGESPHGYLLTRRLERAAALLRGTDRPVAEICMAVGLSSVGSFTTSFTRTYGMSPTAYRDAYPPALTRIRLPTCVIRAYGRPGRVTAGAARMEKTSRTTQLWVHDQDEALDFYTRKLGFEVHTDVTVAELGNFRWVSVGPPGQPDVDIVLMAIPGEPVMDAATQAEVRALTAKGFAGTVFFTTDDCWAEYRALSERGVEFIGEPEEQVYGIDVGFRDPSGNNFRLGQRNSTMD